MGYFTKVSKKSDDHDSPLKRFGTGALIAGGVLGATYLHHKVHGGFNPRPSGRTTSSWGRKPPKPAWAKNAKNHGEAKRAYRAEAMKHHPDRGGNAEKMKTLNNEWEELEKHHFPKQSSVLSSFFDELESIFEAA